MSKEKTEEFYSLCNELVDKHLPHFLTNEDLEVQERASSLLQIIEIIKSEDTDMEQLFYAYALNPVAAKAQRKVPVPVGLELDMPFVELEESESEDERVDDMAFVGQEEEEEEMPLTEEQIEKNLLSSEQRKAQMDLNPNYLKSRSKTKKKSSKKQKDIEMAEEVIEEAEEVVVNNVNQNTNNTIPGLISSQNFLKKTKHKKTKKKSKKRNEEEEEEEPEVQHMVTIKGLEMPEGVEGNDLDSDEDMNDSSGLDPHKALAKITFSESDFKSTKYVSKQSKGLDSNKLEENKKKKKTSKKIKTNEDKEEKKVKKKKTKTKLLENGDNSVLDETNTENTAGAKKKTKKADRPKSLELNGEKKKTKKRTKSKTVLEPTEETESTRKRDEYEETAGIETPSLFVPLKSSTQSEPSETPIIETEMLAEN